MCSGSKVFFDSLSQISFASEDSANTNSVPLMSTAPQLREIIPLQQSVMRSLASLAQVNSFGSDSVPVLISTKLVRKSEGRVTLN